MTRQTSLTIQGFPASTYKPTITDRELLIIGSHPNVVREYGSCLYTIGIRDTMMINRSYDLLRRAGYTGCVMNVYVATMHSAECGVHKNFPPSSLPDMATIIGQNVNGAESQYIDQVVDWSPPGGTSALFACVCGIYLGYASMHLIGVHLDEAPYNDEAVFQRWREWGPVLRGRVTSTSRRVERLIN